jgi:release factor glutamine methyltransferase
MQESKQHIKTYRDLLHYLTVKLTNDEAELEAKIIIASLMDKNLSQIYANLDERVNLNKIQHSLSLVTERNQNHVPLAYLLEEAYFYGHRFFVNSDVLVPRPETEILVEQTLTKIRALKIRQPVIVDVGTGSGCIAISLKKALPSATIYATDISSAALSVASINASNHNCEVHFVLGDLLEPFIKHLENPFALPIIRGKPPYFDVVLSNPPYVNASDYDNLADELKHEPKHALVGFPYKVLYKQSLGLLKPKGFSILEHGYDQSAKLKEIIPNSHVIKDYSGIDRFSFYTKG